MNNIGGHNPLDPAHFKCKLISGEFIYNQYGLFESCEGYRLANSTNLYRILEERKGLPKSKLIKQVGKLDEIREIVER